MSTPERRASSLTVVREVDPLLKDLSEKKQSFRRNVVSLAAELKDEAETKAKNMETEISRLEKSLEREICSCRLQHLLLRSILVLKKLMIPDTPMRKRKTFSHGMSAISVGILFPMFILKYCEFTAVCQRIGRPELQLSATRVTADASALSAQSAQLQCSVLVKELEEKNCSLKEHETRVNKLGEQLDLLQKDLRAREFSQIQLKDEVSRIEHEIMQALTKAGANKD
ncbi:Nuclear envelope-associated protein 3, partial [Sesamum angolense]